MDWEDSEMGSSTNKVDISAYLGDSTGMQKNISLEI